MITEVQFRSFTVPAWKQQNDAVVEYSRGIGMLVVSICILKITHNLVDLAAVRLMSYFFFSVKILFCVLLAP